MFNHLNKAHFFCLTLSVLITLTGCSQQQKKDVPKEDIKEEPVVQQTVEQEVIDQDIQQDAPTESTAGTVQNVSESTEQKTEQTQPSEVDLQALRKLEFAVRYMASARKGILPYSQAVVICRDIIKDYPGTQYEKRARDLLKQVPEDQRSRYNITNEELEL